MRFSAILYNFAYKKLCLHRNNNITTAPMFKDGARASSSRKSFKIKMCNLEISVYILMSQNCTFKFVMLYRAILYYVALHFRTWHSLTLTQIKICFDIK